jgi:hypothetical protein
MQKLKVKDENDLAIPADLSIPAFLRRVQTKKEKEESRERIAQFKTSQLPTWSAPAVKPKDDLVEQFRAEEEARRKTKENNRSAKMLAKKQSQEIPPGARWDTRRGRWVVDNLVDPPKPKSKAKAEAEVKQPSRTPSAGRKPGLISTIIELMLRPSGVSVDEVLKVVAERFPGRVTKPNTVNYHAKVNATKVVEDKKRGKVFYRKAKGA